LFVLELLDAGFAANGSQTVADVVVIVRVQNLGAPGSIRHAWMWRDDAGARTYGVDRRSLTPMEPGYAGSVIDGEHYLLRPDVLNKVFQTNDEDFAAFQGAFPMPNGGFDTQGVRVSCSATYEGPLSNESTSTRAKRNAAFGAGSRLPYDLAERINSGAVSLQNPLGH